MNRAPMAAFANFHLNKSHNTMNRNKRRLSENFSSAFPIAKMKHWYFAVHIFSAPLELFHVTESKLCFAHYRKDEGRVFNVAFSFPFLNAAELSRRRKTDFELACEPQPELYILPDKTVHTSYSPSRRAKIDCIIACTLLCPLSATAISGLSKIIGSIFITGKQTTIEFECIENR